MLGDVLWLFWDIGDEAVCSLVSSLNAIVRALDTRDFTVGVQRLFERLTSSSERSSFVLPIGDFFSTDLDHIHTER